MTTEATAARTDGRTLEFVNEDYREVFRAWRALYNLRRFGSVIPSGARDDILFHHFHPPHVNRHSHLTAGRGFRRRLPHDSHLEPVLQQ